MNKRIGSALSSRSNDAIQIGTTFITLDGIKRQIQNSDLNLQKERKKLNGIIRNNSNNINKENQNLLSTNNSVESQQNTIEKDIISSSLNEKKEASFIIKKSQYGKNFHLNFIPLLFGNERYNNYNQGIKTNANISNVNFKNKYLISLLNKNNNKNIKSINATSKRNLILQKNKSFKDKNKLILQKILLNKKSMSKNNIFSKPVLKKDVGTDTCDIKFHQPQPEAHLKSIDFTDKIDNDKPKLPSIRKRIN
jgi:protease II